MSSESASGIDGFARIEDDGSPIRVVLVGAGQMGRHWLDVLTASPLVDLVGLVDLDVPLADRAVADLALRGVATGSGVAEVAARCSAQAVINVTVPIAHHAVNTEALFAGLPVLCEKPIAPSVAQTLSLIATADVSGQLLMTSQSRRYYRNLSAFRDEVKTLGGVELITTEFAKAAHFRGFREEMAHPLLIDMAIHPFDVARYLLDTDPIAVYCETFNPSWSWFAGDAAATAIFEFDGGVRYVYTGSWVSAGLETSWNSSWRASGANGTALWDGESVPTVEYGPDGARPGSAASIVWDGEEIEGALAEFVHALRTGARPSGDVHSNVVSLAMVEAAVESADGGRRVIIDDVLDAAYLAALAAETRDDVRSELESWGSARAGLTVEDVSALS
jgi:predicted dehydrogenase